MTRTATIGASGHHARLAIDCLFAQGLARDVITIARILAELDNRVGDGCDAPATATTKSPRS